MIGLAAITWSMFKNYAALSCIKVGGANRVCARFSLHNFLLKSTCLSWLSVISVGNLINTKMNNDNYIWVVMLDNARVLAHLLKTVQFSDVAIMCATEEGLRVTVETSKSAQANVFIQSSIFQQYELKEETANFQINLNVFLDCLTIFGSGIVPGVSTTLRMQYAGYGSPLKLLLEENEVVTDCSIQTIEAEEMLDFDFSPANIKNKVIMSSESLREAFGELDMTSNVLKISMSPNKPHLRLSTFGDSGNLHVDYPKESDVVELFQCTETQSNKYKISLMKPSVKPLLIAEKVSIRTDNRGMLCLQYLIKVEEGQTCYIDYYCAPLVDDDNEAEEASESQLNE